jgi:hypothetical protein
MGRRAGHSRILCPTVSAVAALHDASTPNAKSFELLHPGSLMLGRGCFICLFAYTIARHSYVPVGLTADWLEQ